MNNIIDQMEKRKKLNPGAYQCVLIIDDTIVTFAVNTDPRDTKKTIERLIRMACNHAVDEYFINTK